MSLPTLTNGRLCVYPLRGEVEYPTTVLRFGNGAQQRFRNGKPIRIWQLQFRGIPWVDVVALRDYFISAKGRFDMTLSVVIDGVTYQYLQFQLSTLRYTLTYHNRYELAINFRAVRAQ